MAHQVRGTWLSFASYTAARPGNSTTSSFRGCSPTIAAVEYDRLSRRHERGRDHRHSSLTARQAERSLR